MSKKKEIEIVVTDELMSIPRKREVIEKFLDKENFQEKEELLKLMEEYGDMRYTLGYEMATADYEDKLIKEYINANYSNSDIKDLTDELNKDWD